MKLLNNYRIRNWFYNGSQSLVFILIFSVLAGCSNDDGKDSIELNYTFEGNDEGWTAGYSDYPADLTPADSLSLYEMSSGHSALPSTISPAQKGIRVRGHNRSDDLFMYIKKKVTGLEPGTAYSVSFTVELASNAPTNAIGAGGPPGEGVTLKAGAKEFEPKNITDSQQWYRMNIDKGNQSAGGTDVVILGNIGVADNTTDFTLITRKSPVSLQKKTNSSGELWLFIGTDSAFEGLTELFYATIMVVLEKK